MGVINRLQCYPYPFIVLGTRTRKRPAGLTNRGDVEAISSKKSSAEDGSLAQEKSPKLLQEQPQHRIKDAHITSNMATKVKKDNKNFIKLIKSRKLAKEVVGLLGNAGMKGTLKHQNCREAERRLCICLQKRESRADASS